jgi:spermidine synthase
LSRISSSSPTSSTDNVRWTQLYLGLGFTTLATLILELSLTRIFSVVFYYHLAFLAISIALFGLGAGGVFSYVVSARPGNLYEKLGTLAVVNSVCVVACLWFLVSRSATSGNLMLAAVYFASALPFFLAGTVVSIAISEAIDRVDRAYFFDLAGAAIGCLLLVPFLELFGGPNTLIAAGVLFATSAAIWFNQAGAFRRRAMAVLVALLLVGLMAANGRRGRVLDIHVAKGMALPDEAFVAWNGISRIGVSQNKGNWSIVIDADAATGIPTAFDWNNLSASDREGILRPGMGLPYELRPGAKALVIGPGGGYDVARALATGSKDITAVEINPIIANDVMRDKFARESHYLYSLPGVKLYIEDGRSFVRRSPSKYQVLQATLVDTWASTAAGAFALSENNLYTSDAFTDYLSHLTDDGMMAFTRWGFDPPRESLRLISLAMTALPRVGESNPARHVMVVREDTAKIQGWGALDTVLISRKPFSDADISHARELIAQKHMDEVYLPGDTPKNPFGRLLTTSDPEAFWRDYPFDVSPVSDDRPFFFYTVQPRDLWRYITTANQSSADFKVQKAVPLLFGLMAVSLCATALILVLPGFLLGTRLPKQKGIVTFLWYFICLGAGYILIQVALIQKFVLLLGHPTYALVVIVFSMLVSSGIGSYFSRRIIDGDDGRLVRVLCAITAMVTVLALIARPLSQSAAVWPLPGKMLITVLAIAPAAFLMGIPFPSGLRRLEERHPPSIRWAWSLNAAASVLGSAGAIFLAIYIGLRATLLVGGALYLCAVAVILATKTTRRPA